MLKKLILKNREIPIPVPIHTLGEAVRWIEDTLLRKDAVLTSAVLEGKDWINELYRKSVKEIRLSDSSHLQIRIETPKDLSSQSLDVVCDLANGIAARIRKIRFHPSQDLDLKLRSDLDEIHSDVQLLLDLISHIDALVEENQTDFIPITRLGQTIAAEHLKVEASLAAGHWQNIAGVLEFQLEPQLKELVREGEKLQIHILTDHLEFTAVG